MRGLFLFLLLLNGCSISLKESSRLYFRNPKIYHGVEDPYLILERLEKFKKTQNIIYGKNTSSKILPCIFLRNQLYVASLKNSLTDNTIKNAALAIEEAYQNDDDAFILACENFLKSEMGKVFLSTQEEFLRSTST